MDKFTNGYLKADEVDIPDIQMDLKRRYREICLNEYGVKARVKVKIEPITDLPLDERCGMTHRYQVRCKA